MESLQRLKVKAARQSGAHATDLVYLLLVLTPLVAASLMSTDGSVSTLHLFGLSVPLRTVCFFHLFSGYNCPVCGMTRSFTFFMHGQFAMAWRLSHAGIPVCVLCIYEAVYRFLKLMRGDFSGIRVFKALEAALIVTACAATVFFFVAQFFVKL